MKYEEIQKKNDGELLKLLVEKRNALRSFRFNTAGTKTRNVKEGSALRKDIARILTHLSGRKQA